MYYCQHLGYWTNSDCCQLCEMREYCDAQADEMNETDETDETMEPQEYFHDHPVIDQRDDGTYLYFHDLPSVLLHPRIHLSDEDSPPPDENQTTD